MALLAADAFAAVTALGGGIALMTGLWFALGYNNQMRQLSSRAGPLPGK